MASDNEKIKSFIKTEYAACAKDPAFFIKKYCYIQAEEGRMLFSIYDFQAKLLNQFRKRKRISIVKSRQLGITTICAAYALWFMLFRADMKVICLAPTQDKARNIVDKVAFAYDNLPTWLREEVVEKNKLSIIFSNGSSIKAASGETDSARSFTAHLLILDEAAFIGNAEKLWASAQQTLTETNGSAIVLSTPLGIGNWFHKNHIAAENGENDFVAFKLPWTVHKKRTQAWRDAQTKELGERMAKQECDADFLSSGNTVIMPETIDFFTEKFMVAPIEMRGALQDFWIWEYPVPGRDYVLISDIGRGDSTDYSTIQVFDLLSSRQVAEYMGHIDTKDFPRLLIHTAEDYNNALMVIERDSYGWGVVKDVIETKYKNLYYSPKEGMVMDAETYLNRNYDNDNSKMVPGFSTNVKFRPMVINSFMGAIERKEVIIQSKRTIDQFRTFIWNDVGKAVAAKGYNDDLIIPIGIYVFLRDTAIRFSSNAQNITRMSIDHISMGQFKPKKQAPPVIDNNIRREDKHKDSQIYKNGPQNDSWKMRVTGGNQEDLRWLL